MSKKSVFVHLPYIDGPPPVLVVGEQGYDLDELSSSGLRELVTEDQAQKIEADLADWRNRNFPDPGELCAQEELA